jgi:hypothetical protein
MLDVTTFSERAAAIVDPKGENEDLSVLCGPVAWALENPDRYSGWDAETPLDVRRRCRGGRRGSATVYRRVIGEDDKRLQHGDTGPRK